MRDDEAATTPSRDGGRRSEPGGGRGHEGGPGNGAGRGHEGGHRGDRGRRGRQGGGTGTQSDKNRQNDPEALARQVCLNLLTLAPRSRAQLATALRRRGIPGDVADDVLARFSDAGLVDDAAFARAWVESRHHSRGLAGRVLTAELRQRGVGDDEIGEAVAGLGPDAEADAARRLVERKLAATRGQPNQARVRRLTGMLARKGYPPGLAFRIVREAMEAEGAEVNLEEEMYFDDPYSDTE